MYLSTVRIAVLAVTKAVGTIEWIMRGSDFKCGLLVGRLLVSSKKCFNLSFSLKIEEEKFEQTAILKLAKLQNSPGYKLNKNLNIYPPNTNTTKAVHVYSSLRAKVKLSNRLMRARHNANTTDHI